MTDANGCDTTICDTVSVSCTPTSCDAQFTYSYASCDSIWFVPSSLGSQYTYSWDFGDGTFGTGMYASHQYSSNGTYPVVLYITDSVSGCSDIHTELVTVNCSACSVSGDFAWTVNMNNCNVQFISTESGGTAPYTFYWNFGDGGTSNLANPTHQFPANTSPGWWWTCLTITDSNGCDTVICDTISPNCSLPNCDAQFTAVNVTCDSIWFYPVSYGPQYSYYWDFGDGSTSTTSSPTHVYSTDGTYTVSLMIIDSLAMCSNIQVQTVIVACGGTCTVDGGFSYSVDSNNCSVQFISSAWGGVAPYSYYWTFGDGGNSNSANPSHLYPTGGTWTPCLTITDANGCDTSFCLPINVNCNPQSCNGDFTYTPITCDSIWFTPVNYSNTASYTWYFGDGYSSNYQSPAHQYDTNGTYYIILEVWDSLTGCFDSSLVAVNINCTTNCVVNGAFSWYVDSLSCDIHFISTSYGGVAPYTYYWNFGDGNSSTQQHPTHSYPNNTSFTRCLTITDANGCDTTICDVVYSSCLVSCDAQFTYSYVACDSIWFIPNSLGSQYDYYWDFGDGSTSISSNPAHQYTSNGTYTVVLYVIDSLAGCSNAYTALVDVNCGFTPCGVNGAFASYVDSVNCNVYFTSTAFGGTAPYSYYWQFGDGTTSSGATPTHQYATQGTYTPCLTITDANGCDTTICNVVNAYCTPPACNAMFTYTYVSCDSVWFIPNSTGSQITYYWDFGDGGTSSGTNPAHQYSSNGTYYVVLTIIDSMNMCSGSYTVPVNVNCGNCSIGAVTTYVSDSSNCGAYFASSVYGGSGAYSYFWDFGDSTYSSDPYPYHYYGGTGPYQVCLTATDVNGCDTIVCLTVQLNCTVGISENNTSTYIEVYPNPSNSIFNIELPSNADIEVYDVSGKLLIRSTGIKGEQIYPLDLSSVKSGAYILHIKLENEIVLKRLIKQ